VALCHADPTLLEHRASTFQSTEAKPWWVDPQSLSLSLTELPLPLATPQPVVLKSPCPPCVVVAPPPNPNQPYVAGTALLAAGLGVSERMTPLPEQLRRDRLPGSRRGRVRLDVAGVDPCGNLAFEQSGTQCRLSPLYRLAPRVVGFFANTASWGAGPCASVEVGLLPARATACLDFARQLRPVARFVVWRRGRASSVLEQSLLLLSADLGVPGSAIRDHVGRRQGLPDDDSESLGAGLVAGWP